MEEQAGSRTQARGRLRLVGLQSAGFAALIAIVNLFAWDVGWAPGRGQFRDDWPAMMPWTAVLVLLLALGAVLFHLDQVRAAALPFVGGIVISGLLLARYQSPDVPDLGRVFFGSEVREAEVSFTGYPAAITLILGLALFVVGLLGVIGRAPRIRLTGLGFALILPVLGLYAYLFDALSIVQGGASGMSPVAIIALFATALSLTLTSVMNPLVGTVVGPRAGRWVVLTAMALIVVPLAALVITQVLTSVGVSRTDALSGTVIALALAGSLVVQGVVLRAAQRSEWAQITGLNVDGVVIVRPDGTIADANEQVVTLLGWTREEIVGVPIDLLMGAAESTRQDWRQVALADPEVRSTTQTEVTVRRKDGSAIALDIVLTPLDTIDGRMTAAILRDVTREQAERAAARETARRYELLSEHTSDVVLLYDSDEILRWASPTVRTMLGYEPSQLVNHRPSLVLRDDRPGAAAAFAAAVRTRSPSIRERARMQRADGSWLWVDASVKLLYRPDGTYEHAIISIRDVTAQVAAEDATNASERLFRTSMHDSGIGMSLSRPDGTFIEVNDAMGEYFGYSAEELKSRRWVDLTLDEDYEAEESVFQQLVEGRVDDYRIQQRFVRADGTVVVGDMTTSAVRAADGTLEEYITQIVDVTLQARAQADLEEAYEHFRLLAETTTDVVLRMDPEGAITWVSNSVTGARGWAAEELVGMLLIDLVHPDDQPAVLAVEADLAHGEAGRFEARVRGSDGEYRWFSMTLSPIAAGPGFGGRVGIWRDIDDDVQQRLLAAEREVRYRTLAEHASDVVVRAASDGLIEWVSPSSLTAMGWAPEDMVGRTPSEYLHPGDTGRFGTAIARLQPNEPGHLTARIRCSDGQYRWFAGIATRLVADDGEDLGQVLGLHDMQDDVLALESIAESGSRYGEAMAAAPGGMALLDLDLHFLKVNEALSAMTQRDSRWLLAHGLPDLVPDAEGMSPEVTDALGGAGDTNVGEAQLIRADGSTLWVQHAVRVMRDDAGRATAFMAQFVDISGVKQANTDLEFLATHDPLTRLLNRRALVDRMRLVLAHPDRAGTRVGALFVDLDGLKPVNDQYGHAAGDELIGSAGERIRSVVRSEDIVARLGGDEFVVVLNVRDRDDLIGVGDKIRSAISEPLELDHAVVSVTASVGATFAGHGEQPDAVIGRADKALYRAKEGGRNRTVVYDEHMAALPTESRDHRGSRASRLPGPREGDVASAESA